MKQTAFLAVLLLFLTVSCTNSENNTIKISNVKSETSIPLFDGAPYSLSLSVEVDWPTEASDNVALEKIQLLISDFMFRISTMDVNEGIKHFTSDVTAYYREENDGMAEDIEDQWSFMLNWEENLEGKLLPAYNGMASYLRYLYIYSGGAHGMDALSGKTFFLDSGNVVTEDVLFTEGYEERLTEALRAHLLDDIEYPDILFDTEITPSENFYITQEGITYIYQRYEVGPYAMGIIEVTVPWNEIQDILR